VRAAFLLPCCFAAILQAEVPAADLAGMLPKLPGWSAPQAPKRFGPDNLYEHINGAADGFLECDFRELVTQVYEAGASRSLTVEIYRHADPDAAYGIYSQERPAEGRFLAIGGEGYHEQGILNFVKGACYVKLSAFGLGDPDREPLERTARAIAERIPGGSGLPALLLAFPRDGQVAGSQRYLRRNILGYPFLEYAFTIQYKQDGKTVSLWIFAPPAAAQSGDMLAKYLRVHGLAEPVKPGQPVTLVDKHHGSVSLLLSGGHLLAAVGGEPRAHGALLERLRTGLAPKAGSGPAPSPGR
jgi:hypothetical protein